MYQNTNLKFENRVNKVLINFFRNEHKEKSQRSVKNSCNRATKLTCVNNFDKSKNVVKSMSIRNTLMKIN